MSTSFPRGQDCHRAAAWHWTEALWERPLASWPAYTREGLHLSQAAPLGRTGTLALQGLALATRTPVTAHRRVPLCAPSGLGGASAQLSARAACWQQGWPAGKGAGGGLGPLGITGRRRLQTGHMHIRYSGFQLPTEKHRSFPRRGAENQPPDLLPGHWTAPRLTLFCFRKTENSHPAAQMNALGLAFPRMVPQDFTSVPFQDTPRKGFHDRTTGPCRLYCLSGEIRNAHQDTQVSQSGPAYLVQPSLSRTYRPQNSPPR